MLHIALRLAWSYLTLKLYIVFVQMLMYAGSYAESLLTCLTER